MIINNICEDCGSDRLGYMCRCGEMACSCRQSECPTCEANEEYAEQQRRHDTEEQERANFENTMEEKYGR